MMKPMKQGVKKVTKKDMMMGKMNLMKKVIKMDIVKDFVKEL